LEKSSYEILDKVIENEQGFKIFVFHSAIEDYKPTHLKGMDAIPLNLFPKNFDYYAGGHIHKKFEKQENGYGTIAFPGALFPTSFDELEKNNPGFYFVRFDENKINLQWYDLDLFGIKSIKIDANEKSAKQVEKEILEEVDKSNIKNKIVLLRIEGMLENGLPSEIDFRMILSKAMEKNAKTLKKNMSKLTTKEFEEVKVVPNISIEELEKRIITEHLEQIKFGKLSEEQTSNLIFDLMNTLKEEKLEGETNVSYEERIKTNAKKILEL
jgi:DNA repair exonuclease SbcCD nuclease subunit